MKINIIKQKPDEVQDFFSAPLSFSQKVVMKKLLIVEQLLERMKAIGLNRSKFAEKMSISSARVTSMLDGTNNFTLETMLRAADAVDGEFHWVIAPKGHEVKWSVFCEESIHPAFKPARETVHQPTAEFKMSAIAQEDQANAA
ncbi:MAG: hypothetical protein HC845_15370 [Akkermansiaceae bacterium]|nr:hypothetical protein [Akkermansiaceae bacterium]